MTVSSNHPFRNNTSLTRNTTPAGCLDLQKRDQMAVTQTPRHVYCTADWIIHRFPSHNFLHMFVPPFCVMQLAGQGASAEQADTYRQTCGAAEKLLHNKECVPAHSHNHPLPTHVISCTYSAVPRPNPKPTIDTKEVQGITAQLRAAAAAAVASDEGASAEGVLIRCCCAWCSKG